MDQVGPRMAGDIATLFGVIGDKKDNIAGDVFSIYHKWDFVKKTVSYTSGIPVQSVPAVLPDGVFASSIPSTSVYTVRHVGSYQHLGNAWTTLYTMHRNKEFKMIKGLHPFETYVNSPGEVPDHELITDIHFPMKG